MMAYLFAVSIGLTFSVGYAGTYDAIKLGNTSTTRVVNLWFEKHPAVSNIIYTHRSEYKCLVFWN